MSYHEQTNNRWVDLVAFIEKTPWTELCSAAVVADQVATRGELETAVRMAFAGNVDPFAPSASSQVKTQYLQKLKLCRALVASLTLSENIPRIASLVFEGLESAIEDSAAIDARMILATRKKSASSLLNSRQQWVGVGRFPISTLALMAWLRISKINVVDDEEDKEAAAAQQRKGATSGGRSTRPAWPPVSVGGAKRFLARVLPICFIPTFVFASTSSTIPGLLSTITSVANEAASGFLSTADPMSRCALICVAASGDGIETAIVSELTTADVQGEKGFFRTPVSHPCSSETLASQQNDVFTIAQWFNTSDQAAPFSISQMHHFFLVYALRRSMSRIEISRPAAHKWLHYCEAVVKDVEAFASKVLGRSASRSIHWISSGTKGIGVRFWDSLMRECALMCEAAAVHMTKPESQLSTLLWMLVSHASQGVRGALSLREYDPLLEIRDSDGSSAANAIQLAPPTHSRGSGGAGQSSAAIRPFVCSPEQLFVVCRAALRCDVSLTRQEKTARATNFMMDVCTEELLVSLALDPSQAACTLVALLRFCAEFFVPLEPHMHLIISVVALSPLVGSTILNDHLRFVYKCLSSVGRVELLLRILFLPLTSAAFELQMALAEAPVVGDFEDASFCLFHLWRCISPINAVSRTHAMKLYTIFRACFALAFNNDSDFKLMWECCMLDDLSLMGERERAASVCVKDTLLDAFFECVAENGMNSKLSRRTRASHDQDPHLEEEGILHAATFMFRFGVFPRMHCAAILKRIVLHVRVLLGTTSISNSAAASDGDVGSANQQSSSSMEISTSSTTGTTTNTTTNNNNSIHQSNATVAAGASTSISTYNPNPNPSSLSSTSSSSMASTLLQFLCGFGTSNVGVLHDDFDRYSDAFFDAIANVLVIAGKFAASQGERSASRVFHSLHDLAWECLTSFRTSTISTSSARGGDGGGSGAVFALDGKAPPSSSSRPTRFDSVLSANSASSGSQPTSSSSGPNSNNNNASSSSLNSANQQPLCRRGLPPAVTAANTSVNVSAQQLAVAPATQRNSPVQSRKFSEFSQHTSSSSNKGEQQQQPAKSTIRSFVTFSSSPTIPDEALLEQKRRQQTLAYDHHGDNDFLLYCEEDSISVMDLQPTINFVGLRVVGLRTSIPSVQERMLKRLEAIAIALTHVTARHVSLRERAVIWLRACWKGAESWLTAYHNHNNNNNTNNNNNGTGSAGLDQHLTTQSQIQNLFASLNQQRPQQPTSISGKKSNKNKGTSKSISTANESPSNSSNSQPLISSSVISLLASTSNENTSRRNKNPGEEMMRERCEQLCITCSSLCNLLLNHNDVLLAAAGGSV